MRILHNNKRLTKEGLQCNRYVASCILVHYILIIMLLISYEAMTMIYLLQHMLNLW